MKNRITFLLLQGLAAGVVAILAQDVQGQVLYNNTGASGGTSSQVGNYSFGNGGNSQAGNEIIVGNGVSKYDITSFAVQFFLTGTTFSGSPTVTLTFYDNNGASVSGYPAPGTQIYSSSYTATAFTPASGSTLTFTPDVTVPSDFTWTLTFSGVAAGDSAGLSIFNSSTVNGSGVPTPAVGGNYNDAWVNTSTTATPSWTLVQSTPNPDNPGLQFGVLAQGTSVPEPSTIALGLLGACGFLARRRKS
jgi:hypothetical protein